MPPMPKVFFRNNTTSSSTILQVYGHCGNVPVERFALLGQAAIVDHLTGSGARRLRFVFLRQKWLET